MNKKNLSILSLVTFSLVIGTTLFVANNNPMSLFLSNATNNPYSLVFNKNQNKFHNKSGVTPYSGTASVYTELGGEIVYTYSNIIGGGSNTWQVLGASNSYFYNQNPINGVNSMSLSFNTDNGEFKIYWSDTETFTEDRSQVLTSNMDSKTIFDFYDFNPNYIKVENTSGLNLNISEITFTYSCENQYYQLSRTSEDERLGTVSGDSGTIKAGTDVIVQATPKEGGRFDGWYLNSMKVSDKNPYEFDMPHSNLDLFAKFVPQQYTVVLTSSNEERGTVVGSGQYDYLSQVTVTAIEKNGYEFEGWYDQGTRISTDASYTFTMPNYNYSLVARFIVRTYIMTVSSNDITKGTVTGGGDYIYKSNVVLVASPAVGCHFVGWYNGDKLVSTNNVHSFTMPYNDLNYVGKFEFTNYSLTVSSEDEEKGTVTGSGNYIYNEKVSIKASPNPGYAFLGWYIDDELLSKDAFYEYTMPLHDVSIVAKFVNAFNLYVESDDLETGNVISPSTSGEGFEVTVKAIPNEGYMFNYWYDENFKEISRDWCYSFTMPSDDVILFASFIEGGIKVNVDYSSARGLVEGNHNYLEGETATLLATPKVDCVFKGWFEDSSYTELISKDLSYSFTMPAEEVQLYARFLTTAEDKQEQWDIKHGVIPTMSDNQKTIQYGLYPQTNINDNELISKLNELDTPEENGWYLYEDEYYAKTVATPYRSNYAFHNGTSIISGETYWFKCEPITWNILSNEDGVYYLLSSLLLDSHRYNEFYYGIKDGHYANNYKCSEIREWLNDDFYNTAFNLNDSHILITTVDNSAATTERPINPFACEDTEDKIFFPSYADYVNPSYGFTYDARRCCSTTDWARAKGIYYYIDDGYAHYWTRSPDEYDGHYAQMVNGEGRINVRCTVGDNDGGVRPAFRFTF